MVLWRSMQRTCQNNSRATNDLDEYGNILAEPIIESSSIHIFPQPALITTPWTDGPIEDMSSGPRLSNYRCMAGWI